MPGNRSLTVYGSAGVWVYGWSLMTRSVEARIDQLYAVSDQVAPCRKSLPESPFCPQWENPPKKPQSRPLRLTVRAATATPSVIREYRKLPRRNWAVSCRKHHSPAIRSVSSDYLPGWRVCVNVQGRPRSQERYGPIGHSSLRLRMCSVRIEAESNQDLPNGASVRKAARTRPTAG